MRNAPPQVEAGADLPDRGVEDLERLGLAREPPPELRHRRVPADDVDVARWEQGAEVHGRREAAGHRREVPAGQCLEEQPSGRESDVGRASVVAGVVSTSWSMGRLYDEHERAASVIHPMVGPRPARPASLPVDGGRDQPVAHGVERGRTARRHADLGVDVLDVGAHGARRDAELVGRSACWNDRGPAGRAPRPPEWSARPAAPDGGGPGDPRRRARRAPHHRRGDRRGTRPAAPTRAPAAGARRRWADPPRARGRRRRRRRCGPSSGCRDPLRPRG